MKVVVTGGAGLIGSHLVDRIVAAGASVTVVDDFSRGRAEHLDEALASGCVTVLEGDVRDADLMRRAAADAAAVVHMAAAFRRVAHLEPRTGLDVNVGGTLTVLDACVGAGVRRIVFASTAGVYGEGASTTFPTLETHPLLAEYFDGALKVAGEQLLRAFHKQHGLEFVALRYANVYGPRSPIAGPSDIVTALINRIESGESPVLNGDGSQRMDLVHVSDAARAAELAIEAPVRADVFNIGSGRPTTVKMLAEHLIDRLVGSAAMTPVYKPCDPASIPHTFVDTAHAATGLGFRAVVPLDEGISSVLQWRQTAKVMY